MLASKLLAAALLASASVAFAFTSPGAPSAPVNDFANVIDDTVETELNARINAWSASTSAELAVATVSTLGGDDIETYANALFREWGVGSAATNRGILLLIAPTEREVRIEVGYGLEGTVPDAIAARIIDEYIIPQFAVGNITEGTRQGVMRIMKTVDGSPLPKTVDSEPFYDIHLIVYVFIIVTQWILAILARSKSWWLGGVLGAIAAALITFLNLEAALIAAPFLIIAGLILDYVVSNEYRRARERGEVPPWYIGGSLGRSSSGSSFGGFGGGSSGGGGASGRW